MSVMSENTEFHIAELEASTESLWIIKEETEFACIFENFFHPFVGELIEQLNRKSLSGMLDPAFHKSLVDNQKLSNPLPTSNTFFTFYKGFYEKTSGEEAKSVNVKGFPKEIDLRDGAPYANYNWELLFHIPLTIAVHLSKNQRFA